MIRRVVAFILLVVVAPLLLAPPHAHARGDRARHIICPQRARTRTPRRPLERRARRRRDNPGAGDDDRDELVTDDEVRAALAESARLAPLWMPVAPAYVQRLAEAHWDLLRRWIVDRASVSADEIDGASRSTIIAAQWRAAAGQPEFADARNRRLDLLERMRATKTSQRASNNVRVASRLTRRVNRQVEPDSAESPAMQLDLHHAAEAAEADLIGRNLRATIAQTPPPLNTYRAVAAAIDVAPTQFSRWANGKQQPRAAHLRDLERILGKPRGYFASEHPELEAPPE